MATFSGSCICGAVRYEITGEPRAFFHCHCSRCRKSSGTGHASNVIVRPEKVTWHSGEELLNSWRVPEAERFRTVFCRRCGSPLPRVAPDFRYATIPAGSLDGDPGVAPVAHIMFDSKTAWSCPAGELPAWPEYPA